MYYKLSLFSFLCFIGISFANPIDTLKSKLDELLATEQQAHIGIKIVCLKTGECLYQKNNTKLFTPASNVKLFTCAAALSLLGKEYTFETVLATDGTVKRKILHGNLYIKASGDPSLTTKDLEALVLKLKEKNICAIHGNIIADATIFDELSYGPGWSWDDGSAPYNSPISGLTINHNCITLQVFAESPTLAPTITLDPQTAYVTFENKATLVDANEPQSLQVKRRWLTKENVFEITGNLSKGSTPKKYRHTIENPRFYAATLLHEMLVKQGIQCKGSYAEGKTPSTATILATHQSAPLHELLTFMMKNTDNLYAECIFKKLGAHVYGTPGTWTTGKEVITQFIEQELHIPKTQFKIVDGSGLSRYTTISPDQIIALLDWVSEHTLLSQQFLSSLPIAGQDGTLKERMTHEDVRTKVHAKTGTLGGITALSGYVTTQDNEILAFTILINGLIKGSWVEYKVVEDTLCTYLATFSRQQEKVAAPALALQ